MPQTLNEFLDEIEKSEDGGCPYCCGACNTATKIIREMEKAVRLLNLPFEMRDCNLHICLDLNKKIDKILNGDKND